MLNGIEDFGGSDYRWVVTDTSQTQGTWGVFKRDPHLPSSHGWRLDAPAFLRRFIFIASPDPVANPVSSHGGGFSNAESAAWTLEWQIWSSQGVNFRLQLNSGADVAYDAPANNMTSVVVNWDTGACQLDWNDRDGTSLSSSTSSVVKQDVWQHVCLMKSAGSYEVACYLDSLLINRLTPTNPQASIATIEAMMPQGSVHLREIFLRTTAGAYPVIPFTPGDVTFAGSIGNTQLRWNSMML
jgi:hypothetical protein